MHRPVSKFLLQVHDKETIVKLHITVLLFYFITKS